MDEEKVPEAGKEPIERSYQPATQDPNALLNDAPVTEGASAEERTEALFTRLHSSRRFLNGHPRVLPRGAHGKRGHGRGRAHEGA